MPKNSLDRLRYQVLNKDDNTLTELNVYLSSSTPSQSDLQELDYCYCYLYQNAQDPKGWRNDGFRNCWDCKSHWSFPMKGKLKRKIDKINLDDNRELHRWATQLNLSPRFASGPTRQEENTFVEYFVKLKGKDVPGFNQSKAGAIGTLRRRLAVPQSLLSSSSVPTLPAMTSPLSSLPIPTMPSVPTQSNDFLIKGGNPLFNVSNTSTPLVFSNLQDPSTQYYRSSPVSFNPNFSLNLGQITPPSPTNVIAYWQDLHDRAVLLDQLPALQKQLLWQVFRNSMFSMFFTTGSLDGSDSFVDLIERFKTVFGTQTNHPAVELFNLSTRPEPLSNNPAMTSFRPVLPTSYAPSSMPYSYAPQTTIPSQFGIYNTMPKVPPLPQSSTTTLVSPQANSEDDPKTKSMSVSSLVS